MNIENLSWQAPRPKTEQASIRTTIENLAGQAPRPETELVISAADAHAPRWASCASTGLLTHAKAYEDRRCTHVEACEGGRGFACLLNASCFGMRVLRSGTSCRCQRTLKCFFNRPFCTGGFEYSHGCVSALASLQTKQAAGM